MSPRHLQHIPRHLFRVILVILAVVVVLFFALTRTQVGREGLRIQLEHAFADAFEGRLEISTLKGNLVQSLFARDVRLYDPEGRLVIAVDSVVAHPSWRALLGRRLSIRALTLFRPQAVLLYQADSTWNVTSAFRKRTREPSSEPWRFESAEVHLVDGALRTLHEAEPPPGVREGRVFNYTNASIEGLQLRATVEGEDANRLIDVLAFSATIPEVGLTVDDLRGQVVVDSSRVLVNQFVLQAGRTDVRLDLAVDQPRSGRSFALDAELLTSRIDLGAWRRLFPSLPVADVVEVAAKVAGPLDRLVVETLHADRGQTHVEAEGTILGLPDSLDFEVALRNTTVAAADVQAVYPAAGVGDLAYLGPLRLDGEARGMARLTPQTFHADAEVEVSAAAGRVAGTLSLARGPDGASAFAFDVQTNSLDVGRLARREGLASALDGRLVGRGRLRSLDSLEATMQASLTRSLFARRLIDTLHVDGSVAAGRWEATLFARQGAGGVYGTAEVNLSARRPSLRVGLVTRRLDLGRVLDDASLASSLNSTWTLDAAGTSWHDVQGRLLVRLDTSDVRLADAARLIPAQQFELHLNHAQGGQPRVSLTGDAFSARFDGEAAIAPLQAVAGLWQPAFAEAVERQAAKPFPRDGGVRKDAVSVVPSLDQISRREAARAALRDAGLDAIVLDLTLDVHRADLLGALLPMLPSLGTDLQTSLRLTADADRLQFKGRASGDSLATDAFDTDGFAVELRADASLGAPVEASLTAALDVQADSVRLGGQTFRAPSLTARYQHREAQFTLTTDRNGRTGPVRLAAALELLPDRNRLSLLDFYLALDNYVWRHAEDEPIDLYEGVAVVPGISLESEAVGDLPRQRVRFSGALSTAAEDTFYVDVEHLGLRQLSTTLALNKSLGGLLNGRLALTNVARPELTGTVSVDGFALDDNLLGRLHLTSQYQPLLPDVALNLRLTPEDDAPPGFNVKQNDLRLDGTFRLPAEGDPGALDLRLDVQRADAFFMEYVISELDNVTGAFAGAGAVRGSFKKPLFEADLRLVGGRFDIPKFNLRYLADGAVQVDEEAIRLGDIRINDPTGGAAVVSGNIFFNDYRFLSFGLDARLDALQIIDVPNSRELPFYGSIWASGTATVTGPLFNPRLTSTDVVTTPQSEVFIPLTEGDIEVDPGFIVFTDSTGRLPKTQRPVRRKNILARRPEGERSFTEGLEMDLNIFAPQGSTVHLVIDPLLGDVINAVGSGRIQLQRREGEFLTFGSLEVDGGDYLFTAGEVFVRRFLIEEGRITWDGDPLDARLDIDASYRTRASRAGLPADIADRLQPLIPLIVQLHITGRVSSPLVALNLAVDRNRQEAISDTQFLEAYLNQSDRAAQHATSVLLTNSFLLTTEGTESDVLAGSAFNSVSQLVSSQLNRYLSQVVPNADFTFGVQGDETAQDLDVTAGLAIRLLNERLVIRGQGIYRGLRPADDVGNTAQQGLQGEFVVEVRLSPSISVEVFYRREGDVLSESLLTSTTGAGLSYQTQFPTWRRLFQRLFGIDGDEPPADTTAAPVVEMREE